MTKDKDMVSMGLCKTCAFYDPFTGLNETSQHLANKGYCREHPPTVFILNGAPTALFPIVSNIDWCACYKH